MLVWVVARIPSRFPLTGAPRRAALNKPLHGSFSLPQITKIDSCNYLPIGGSQHFVRHLLYLRYMSVFVYRTNRGDLSITGSG